MPYKLSEFSKKSKLNGVVFWMVRAAILGAKLLQKESNENLPFPGSSLGPPWRSRGASGERRGSARGVAGVSGERRGVSGERRGGVGGTQGGTRGTSGGIHGNVQGCPRNAQRLHGTSDAIPASFTIILASILGGRWLFWASILMFFIVIFLLK